MSLRLLPAIYEHAAQLIGARPWDVSRNAELLARAHATAHDIYGHEPLIPGIDIYNLESEAYGLTVNEPAGNGVPTITEHPYEMAEELNELPELDLSSGRIPLMFDAVERLRQMKPSAPITFPIAGPFAIATNILGMDNLLCELIECPEDVAQALDKIVQGQLALCHAIRQAGFGITVFESGSAPPLVSPEIFRRVIFPTLSSFCKQAKSVTGQPIGLVLGGDTAKIVDVLAKLEVGFMICPAETDQESWIKGMLERSDITVRINMSASILASGNRQAISAELERLCRLADLCPGNVCLGTGVLPYDFDPKVYQVIRQDTFKKVDNPIIIETILSKRE